MANYFTVSGKLQEAARHFSRPLYAVGGAVRNAWLGLPVREWDLCSACSVEEAKTAFLAAGFCVQAVYPRFGTLKVACRETGESFEYTQFRTDSYRAGGEHCPQTVRFTDDLFADALRRDFRMNAIYRDILSGETIDPLGGREDLKAGRIRCTRDPEQVFAEDGLRLLRLVRQAAELGLQPDPETLSAAARFRDNLDSIHPERVQAEMKRIAFSDQAYQKPDAHAAGFALLDRLGLLQKIIPEITCGKGLVQRPDFHRYDVFGHTMETFRVSPPPVRIAALFHDVGKPVCFAQSGNFHGHERISGSLAGPLSKRVFGLSDKDAERVSRLCALHMADLKSEMRENRRRLFLTEHLDLLPELMQLKQADYLGCGIRTGQCPTIQRWEDSLLAMKKEGVPLRLTELLVDGRDVLLRRPDLPKQEIKTVLKTLFSECVCGQPNDRERLLGRIDRWKSSAE